MHYTKGIENKNDGIEAKKIFPNCKKDRMEKNTKKYKKKLEGRTSNSCPMCYIWVFIIATSAA